VRANRCFVCGPENPIGLRLAFVEEDGVVCAEFRPTDLHVGYAGIVHGGILAAVLDDAMPTPRSRRAYHARTPRRDVPYRAPRRPGDLWRVRGWIAQAPRRLITAEGEILRGHKRLCWARATFLRHQVERDALG